MATLDVDGKVLEVPDGQNLLEACLSHGVDVPYFCWHPGLGSAGACRLCAVKQYANADDKNGRLVMACVTPVKGPMRFSAQDAEVKAFRTSIIEWLMANHPHDCAVCDAGGQCHLQDMTVMVGHHHRTHRFPKRTYRNQDLGPMVAHEMNRCIQCYRCVRFYGDYAGGTDLQAHSLRNQVWFGRFEDGTLESEFSGNLVEVCPTGVFTDKTSKQHFARKWDLAMAPSVCGSCSVGCNVTPGEKLGKVRGVQNRFHHEINGHFLCDRGRFAYQATQGPSRIAAIGVGGRDQGRALGDVLADVAKSIQAGTAVGIGSPRAFLEDNYALWRLVGADKFSRGLPAAQDALVQRALALLAGSPARRPGAMGVEDADAAFVLGEDPMDTAPRIGLALRQVAWREVKDQGIASGIPDWHDIALRTFATGQKGQLHVAAPWATRLDDVARSSVQLAPDALVRLGFAVAHAIDPEGAPAPDGLDEATKSHAKTIADALLAAKRPVIVSGVHLGVVQLMEAAANVALALKRKEKDAGLVLTVPDANTYGVGLLPGAELEALLDHPGVQTVLILENDLRRLGSEAHVAALLSGKRVVVLDHTTSTATAQADLVLPTAAFAESTGTLVNHELRFQRSFHALAPPEPARTAWMWLDDLGRLIGKAPMVAHDGVLTELRVAVPAVGEAAHRAAHDAAWRPHGAKVPRLPQRASGRTAKDAAKAVSEKQVPGDADSPYAFSMEGFGGPSLGSAASFFWAPSWNSGQSLHKFQEKVGGSLRGGDAGDKGYAPVPQGGEYTPAVVPEAPGGRWFLPRWHVFGSEPVSSRAPAVAARATAPYVGLDRESAAAFGAEINVRTGDTVVRLPVKVDESLAKGVVALPVGLVGVSPLPMVPAKAQLEAP